MRRTIAVVSIILLVAQFVSAQDFFTNVSPQQWIGSGELMGSTASFQMDWEPILDGKFYKLSFQNQREASKAFVFKAMGIYRPEDDGSFTGTWFDSRGYSFPLKGNFTENELTVHWGNPETEEGKTSYSIKEDGTITVKDDVLKDGKLVPFGNAVYRRP